MEEATGQTAMVIIISLCVLQPIIGSKDLRVPPLLGQEGASVDAMVQRCKAKR